MRHLGVISVMCLLGVASAINFSDEEHKGANYNDSHTKNKYSQKDKALLVGQALVDHDHVFQQLEEIFYAYQDFAKSQPKSQVNGIFADFVLSRLPFLLRSPDFQDVMFIIADEINRVDIRKVGQLQQANNWTSSNPNVTNELINTYQHNLNFQRMIQRIMMRRSARVYFPYNATAMPNGQCYNDTMDFMDSLVGGRYPTVSPKEFNFTTFWWALKMFDSIGKPAGGITKGALYYIGSYDECTKIQAYIPSNITVGNIWRKHETSFSTKFCRAKFNVSESFVKSLNVDTRGVKLMLNWGICVPATCSSEDIANLFAISPVSLPLNTVQCVERPDLANDTSAIVAIIILSTFGAIVALCTISEGVLSCIPVSKKPLSGKVNKGYLQDESVIIKNGYAPDPIELKPTSYKELEKDYTTEEEPSGVNLQANGHKGSSIEMTPSERKAIDAGVQLQTSPPTPPEPEPEQARKISPFIKAFSVLTNLPKLLHAKKSPTAFNSVHGIRFVSMLWIVLGHTYNYGVISDAENPTTANLVDAASLFERFTFQGIMAAGFAVDTFFLLSAFLVSYITLKDLGKKKVKGGYMLMFYFHRFWRLTPLYMIVLMAFSCLYPYMGDGPLWPEAIKAADYCKTNWWTNMLYVNNLVRNHNQCLGWSWYLANDMQFYVISPIFIFTLHWYAPIGVALITGVGVAGVGSAFYAEYITGGDTFSLNKTPDYWQNVYTVPWTRVAAWMVGLILGWIMYKTDKIKKIGLKTAVIGWIITITVGVFISYITYTFRQEDGEPWPRWLTSLYESTTRPIFAACVAWVIYACHKQRGGIINDVLSWNGIIPLSRLTYACYLLHPTIMMMKVFGQKSLVYISDFDVAYLYMGHTCMTFMIAVIFSVTFEAPFLALEKILFHR